MALVNYHPAVSIKGEFEEVINQRLMSWELVDASGHQSDQLTLEVDMLGVETLPQLGAPIVFYVGYQHGEALVYKGKFIISRIKPKLYPSALTIIATAAPFIGSNSKEFNYKRERCFEKKTLGEIFRHIVTQYQFEPRITNELDNIPIAYIQQSKETDMSFLSRLAKKYNAVAKPVDDFYIMAKKDQIKSMSGKILPTLHLSQPDDNHPSKQGFINLDVDFVGRTQFNGIEVKYDVSGQWFSEIYAYGDKPFNRLSQTAADKEQAIKIAHCAFQQSRLSEMQMRLDVPGDPEIVAQGLIELDNTFPFYAQGVWIIERVTSRGSASTGYRCSIEAIKKQADSQ